MYSDPFYTSVTYRGAFGPNSDWDKCWTEWDPENADYSTAPVDYVAAYSAFTSQVNNNIVTFAAPAGAGLTYAWDFGDFNTSTQANPEHVYQALGTYNVSLLITTPRGCSKTITGTVTITSGTPEIAVNGDITTNTTWTSNNIYRLTGAACIYVRNNSTLTIQPGTIIKGDPSALVITRGSKIIADGTAEQPIVFTSAQPAGQRAAGDWGGLIILGNAPINTPGGQSVVEGGCDPTLAAYGGANAADNSGILRYVRVEFAGIAFQPNNELNSFTFGGVGSGTVIEHVQSSFGGDDALEWFGGTVNGKWMIAYKTVDDMFDTDFGYQGKKPVCTGYQRSQRGRHLGL
ncbi:MAG: PKD domain-containing protein [Saprospiraceae bacterium]|nr:PKD domain-containing protein [Saprospiraceae bacterium]